jgi:hypothetical protein
MAQAYYRTHAGSILIYGAGSGAILKIAQVMAITSFTGNESRLAHPDCRCLPCGMKAHQLSFLIEAQGSRSSNSR